jgi:hypothetical protein
MATESIADLYWQLHAQLRSTWSFEFDIRSFDERF